MSITLTPDSPPAPDIAHVRDVDPPRFPNEQEQFDSAVARNTRMLVPALAGVAILAALVMSAFALIMSTGTGATTAITMPMAIATAPAPAVGPTISLSVAGSNKKGPDGKMHDSFSTTDFAVKVGQATRLRINNTDSSPHTITSVAAGVNITVLPGVHTYTMVARATGRFEWVCVLPCDSGANGWAMSQPGYMAGYITAT